jgi:hypothetical protein
MPEQKPFVVKPGRIACCVPFCRRTFKHNGEHEVICSRHAQLADKRYRRLLSRIHRRIKRGTISDAIAEPLCRQLWDKIKDQAISRC